MANETFLEIPYQQLSEDALSGILDEFISREGTDYGDIEISHDRKYQQLLAALQAGRCKIVFDPVSESCTLIESVRR